MINVVSQTITRPIYAAGSVLGACKDALMDLVKKIQEVIKNVWESICWCCYSKADSTAPLNITQASANAVLVPRPGAGDDAGLREMPPAEERQPGMRQFGQPIEALRNRIEGIRDARLAEPPIVFGELQADAHDDDEEALALLAALVDEEEVEIAGAEEAQEVDDVEEEGEIAGAEEAHEVDEVEEEGEIAGAEEAHEVDVLEEDEEIDLAGAEELAPPAAAAEEHDDIEVEDEEGLNAACEQLAAMFPQPPPQLPQPLQPQDQGVVEVVDLEEGNPPPVVPVPLAQAQDGGAAAVGVIAAAGAEGDLVDRLHDAVAAQNTDGIDFREIQEAQANTKRMWMERLTEIAIQKRQTCYFFLQKHQTDTFLCVRIIPPQHPGGVAQYYWFGKNTGPQDNNPYVPYEVIGIRQ